MWWSESVAEEGKVWRRRHVVIPVCQVCTGLYSGTSGMKRRSRGGR